jgi:multiple sugar transport system permease protein
MYRTRSARLVRQVGIYLGVIAALVALNFPLYWMLNVSVAPDDQLIVFPPRFFHPNASLNAYITLLTERPFGTWITNSLWVVFMSVGFSMLVAIFAGYSLSRFRVPGRIAAGYLLLSSRMLPTTLLVIPLFITMRDLGLMNSHWALIIANLTIVTPFATWMLKGYFDSIPKELEESATVDGCSRMGVITRITIPLAAPGLAATALYAAILAWDEYLFARTFLSSEKLWTISVGLGSFKGEYMTKWNEVMAASLLGTVPIMIIFVFLEKYMVSGLTAGSVKS